MQYTKETKNYINIQINIYQDYLKNVCLPLPKLNTHKGLKDFLLYLGRIGKDIGLAESCDSFLAKIGLATLADFVPIFDAIVDV